MFCSFLGGGGTGITLVVTDSEIRQDLSDVQSYTKSVFGKDYKWEYLGGNLFLNFMLDYKSEYPDIGM